MTSYAGFLQFGVVSAVWLCLPAAGFATSIVRDAGVRPFIGTHKLSVTDADHVLSVSIRRARIATPRDEGERDTANPEQDVIIAKRLESRCRQNALKFNETIADYHSSAKRIVRLTSRPDSLDEMTGQCKIQLLPASLHLSHPEAQVLLRKISVFSTTSFKQPTLMFLEMTLCGPMKFRALHPMQVIRALLPCNLANLSQHDFLLYSMLALSLSHLAAAQPSSPQLKFAAMGHRVKAISSLNEAIGRPIESLEQANAMIATCFSLSVQSTVLEDGLVDFMMFLRGVVAISIYMRQKGFKFLFHHMFDLTEAVASELSGSVLTNSSYARGVCRSLELLHPLVQSTTEVECHRLLLSAAKALFTSSREAYISLSEVYSLFSYHMSQEEFSHFINPSNEVGKLLQTHFVALRLIMTPIISKESFGRKVSTVVEADKTMSQWLGTLVKDVKPDMKKYFEWPIWLHSEVVAGRLALGYEAIRHDSAHSSTFM
ncbi:hypothetical protein BGZ63DRAFT_403337 [Mariannaea sp. PMI_226]|nr:hypothetical protein BGZ63DRAFT_403337 [Mariannaea sp. PMI_226]